MKLVWFGGYSDRDYGTAGSTIGERRDITPKYYISAARMVTSGEYAGILVINIDMKYFASIYNYLDDTADSKLYVVNKSGVIISDLDVTRIGIHSISYEELAPQFANDTPVFTGQYNKEQVVFHKLDAMQLILVNEISTLLITRDVSRLRNIIVFMVCSGILMVFVLSRFWIYKAAKPLGSIIDAMEKVEQGRLGFTIDKIDTVNEFGDLMRKFNSMSVSMNALVNQNTLIQEEKRSIEIEALQSQIDPHFLYNTINSIKWMASLMKVDSIADSLDALGNMLHPVFRNKDIFCTLRDEVAFVEHYIKIMNFRSGGAYDLTINIPDRLLEYQVLRFIMQPMVENAITHGIASRNDGKIKIVIRDENDDIIIIVSDNGEGINESRLAEIIESLSTGRDIKTSGEGRIGLSNVNRRIKLRFGDEYGIIISSRKNIGTEVVVRIPKVIKSGIIKSTFESDNH